MELKNKKINEIVKIKLKRATTSFSDKNGIKKCDPMYEHRNSNII